MPISVGEWFPFQITMDAHTSRAKLEVRLVYAPNPEAVLGESALWFAGFNANQELKWIKFIASLW